MKARWLFAICGAAAIVVIACAARRVSMNGPIEISASPVVVSIDVPASLAKQHRAILHVAEIEAAARVSGYIEVVDSAKNLVGNITFYGANPKQKISADFALMNPGKRVSITLIPRGLEAPVRIGRLSVIASSTSAP